MKQRYFLAGSQAANELANYSEAWSIADANNYLIYLAWYPLKETISIFNPSLVFTGSGYFNQNYISFLYHLDYS